ncbi:MAG: DUF1638 domain-containing protein [Spirochaetes bacterium]|nr:DUF1638 domain-containing protein [Spirochaetota bacterium]
MTEFYDAKIADMLTDAKGYRKLNGLKRLHVIACRLLWREICYFAALSPHSFTFDFLEQKLHNVPENLHMTLQGAIDRAPDDADAVLLGYGLCSNAVVGITSAKKILVLPRAHDCITFLLGSKERYREYFDAHPGTYWYSPGWIDQSIQPGKERFEALRKAYAERYGEENAAYLMEMEQGWMAKYNNAAYVDLNFGDTDAYREYTKTCAEWLHWRSEMLAGDPVLLRNLMNGKWDDAAFLVVEPGKKIAASNDDMVVKAE